MLKRVLSVVTILMLAAATPAMAVTAKSAPYVGGELGLASPSISDQLEEVGIPPSSGTSGGFGWGGFVGYNYAFNAHWMAGLELSYNANGKASYDYPTGDSLDVHPMSFDLTATGTYLFENGFNIFGKAGAAAVKQNYDETISSVSTSDYVSGVKPVIKIGLGWLFDFNTAGSMNVFAQYTHLFGKSVENAGDSFDPNSDILAINAIEVGLSYNLPI